MRIQHNIMAMNSFRNLGINNNNLSKSLEKLSSGYKINRAGDDVAGLAISEKMRAQIGGLEAAQGNVKDGISLVKTAEGALQEVHDMLNRMVYLTEQSANGTYEDAVDRENLQLELNSLRDEIDRIAESANFNGIKLLDGSLQAPPEALTDADLTAVTGAEGEVTGYTLDATKITEGTQFEIGGQKFLISNDDTELEDLGEDVIGIKINLADSKTIADAASAVAGTGALKTKTDATDLKGAIDAIITGTTANTAAADAAAADDDDAAAAAAAAAVDIINADIKAVTDALSKNLTGYNVTLSEDGTELNFNIVGEGALTLQIGDSSDEYNQLQVNVKNMKSAGIGIGDVDISTQAGAQEAIDKIKGAINTVSTERGNLGAIQNRLEHTQNNLAITRENIQDAESSIRDVDVAEEMMEFTKNNILVQSAQAMLAQANQAPQGVLSLLR